MKRNYLYVGIAIVIVALISTIVLNNQADNDAAIGNNLSVSDKSINGSLIGDNGANNNGDSGQSSGKKNNKDNDGKDINNSTETNNTDDNIEGNNINEENNNTNADKSTNESSLPIIKEEDIATYKFQVIKQKGQLEVTEINNKNYFDLEALARHYGKEFKWDKDSKDREQFFIRLFGINIQGSHLSESVTLNGKSTNLGEPIYKLNKKTFVPADALMEQLGFNMAINGDHLDITIKNVFKALRAVNVF